MIFQLANYSMMAAPLGAAQTLKLQASVLIEPGDVNVFVFVALGDRVVWVNGRGVGVPVLESRRDRIDRDVGRASDLERATRACHHAAPPASS